MARARAARRGLSSGSRARGRRHCQEPGQIRPRHRGGNRHPHATVSRARTAVVSNETTQKRIGKDGKATRSSAKYANRAINPRRTFRRLDECFSTIAKTSPRLKFRCSRRSKPSAPSNACRRVGSFAANLENPHQGNVQTASRGAGERCRPRGRSRRAHFALIRALNDEQFGELFTALREFWPPENEAAI